MIRRFLSLATLALFVAQIAALLGEQHWSFELFTHYAHYYAVAAIVIMILSIGKRMWKTALILTLIFAVNMTILAPYLLATPQAPTTSQTLSILASNFYYRNTDLEEFRALIATENPDIFIIHEASSLWLTEADYYDNSYPYYSRTENLGIPGIFIFSRVPGSFREVPLGTKFGLEFIPAAQNSKPVNLALTQDSNLVNSAIPANLAILAVHPPAPIGASQAAERNAQFNDIAVYAQENELSSVVIGDYNSTPWSPYFQKLLSNSGLHDPRLDFGFIPSWHAHNPLFVLPIDHALVSPELQVTEFRTTDKITSDHLPILIKLSL